MKTDDGKLWWSHNLDNNSMIKTNKKIEISTPVKIKANSSIENVKIECGEPRISHYSKPCCYHDKNNCEFIVQQTLNVEIPISYCVKATGGNSYVNCKD